MKYIHRGWCLQTLAAARLQIPDEFYQKERIAVSDPNSPSLRLGAREVPEYWCDTRIALVDICMFTCLEAQRRCKLALRKQRNINIC